MKKKIIIVLASAAIILALAAVVLGAGMIFKTDNDSLKHDPYFFKALGNELASRGEYSKAIAAYEYSISLAEDLEVRNNLAVLYYKQANYNKAIEQLRTLIGTDSGNPSYHYDLAVNLVDKFRNTEDKTIDDLNEALAEYEKADSLMPGFSHSTENIEVLNKVLGLN